MHRPSARLLPIALVVRAEVARKGELFETGDARHLDTFPMARATVGYVFDVIDLPHAQVHVGGALSVLGVADIVKAEYGGHQQGLLTFVGTEAH